MRVIEISNPAYLHLEHQQLKIKQDDKERGSIPVEDMSALILDNPQILITQGCLAYLQQEAVAVISCNRAHQPAGMFLPLVGNSLQAERFLAQSDAGVSLKKRLWKQIVQAKVRMQGNVLKDLTQQNAGLDKLAGKVRSGDPDNIEAQAARRYWRRLFPDHFKRERYGDDQNRYLNYGYAILRALLARALVASGLHAGLGIHHRNRYNDFCLADDLMEPYRPFVDVIAWQLVEDLGADHELDQEAKKRLLNIVKQPVAMETGTTDLLNAAQLSAQSLAMCFLGERDRLALPT